MKTFDQLAIKDINDFIFGKCTNPIVLGNGLSIGTGNVYPELNFTLPEMQINANTIPDVKKQYESMITECCKRAVELGLKGLVVEYELLPDLTLHSDWGVEITKILREVLDQIQQSNEIRIALRVTPNDIREFSRPPFLRQGNLMEEMFRSFELNAQAGADFLAIESTGGKEIHDDAILNGDLKKSVFALSILGGRDMEFLWDRIVQISERFKVIASGDSACGFANTAMVLAEKHFIPRVWAALIRIISAPRSLVAFERGAIGPGKDCAYENVYLKPITGFPMALEGAEAACAHLSPIGNIAKATPDLWSNESVQNVKLLSGMAPVVSLEQLVYATRLMNTASAQGSRSSLMLRDWFTESDSALDPQAYVLRPNVAIEIAQEIVQEKTTYLRTRRATLVGLKLLREADQENLVKISAIERKWLNRLSAVADELPEDEDKFIDEMVKEIDQSKLRLSEYLLK